MPAFDHHFMPLQPALEGDQYLHLESIGLINFQTSAGHELQVRFLCLDEQVRVIAVTIPEAATGHADQGKWMKQIMENTISALRLSVEPEASPLFTRNGFINLMYQSDDPEPHYQVAIGFPQNPDYRLNINHVLGVFEAISKRTLAPIAGLLAEGQVPAIPPHYRVLSLIRAIELLYEDESERSAALDAFQDHFADLGISEHRFRNALPQVRTRCAHGRSRARANSEPFMGIRYNEPHLFPLLNLLRSVLAHGLRVKHGLELAGVEHRPGTPNGEAATGCGG